MITRRGLMSSASAWSLMATIPSAIIIPSRAGAEIVTAIALTVSFASSLVSLFNKSDGISNQLAILNAKLDTIIELQKITLESIQVLSNQVEKLSLELAQELQNQEMRETLADAIGLLGNIATVTKTLNEDIDTLSIDELKSFQERQLNEFFDRAVQVSAKLEATLQASPVSTDRGLMMVRLASLAAFLAQGFVPALQGVDAALTERTSNKVSRKLSFGLILASLDSAYRQISENHGPSQIAYEQSQIDSSPFVDHEPQWLNRIAFPSEQPEWRIQVSFVNYHAHGPCNNGVNFNDEARARALISFATPAVDYNTWTNYRYTVSADISGQTALVDGQSFGPYGVKMAVSAMERLHTQTWRVSDAQWSPRKDEDTGHPLLPLRYPGQFYCPGYPMRDRHWGSLVLLERDFRPDLEQHFVRFSDRLDNVTLRRVNMVALERVVTWASNALALAEVSRDALETG